MIHASSIISSKAKIDSSVNIGPFCIIEDNGKLGKKNRLISNVHITGNTTIGEKNVFYPFSSIGTVPQDLKFINEKSYLVIGDKPGNKEKKALELKINVITEDEWI